MMRAIKIFAISLFLIPAIFLSAQSSLTIEIDGLLDKHENSNEELDTNILGILKEGFGFSNDAMGKFGPKDFSEWLFDVSGDTKLQLTMRYMF